MCNTKHGKRVFLMVAAATLWLAPGCQTSNPPLHTPQGAVNHGENFAPPGSVYSDQRIAMAQAANGARADGTLYPQHFDGPTLSALGTNKLDQMLACPAGCNPLDVYLSIANDDLTAQRQQAVDDYLIHHGGLKPEQVVLHIGVNPGSLAPAEPNIVYYPRTENSSASSGSSSSSASAAPAAP